MIAAIKHNPPNRGAKSYKTPNTSISRSDHSFIKHNYLDRTSASPAGILVNDDGTPILNDDGTYIYVV